MQLCGGLNILWHCLSLGLEWKLTFFSPVELENLPGKKKNYNQKSEYGQCYRASLIHTYKKQ